MATMNISLPDAMRDWVQAQCDTGLYANYSDYIRDLIRKDQVSAQQPLGTSTSVRSIPHLTPTQRKNPSQLAELCNPSSPKAQVLDKEIEMLIQTQADYLQQAIDEGLASGVREYDGIESFLQDMRKKHLSNHP